MIGAFFVVIVGASRAITDHDGRMASDEPRLAVVTTTTDPRVAEAFGKGLTGPDGTVLNIFGTLANHPDMMRRWLVFATHVLTKTTLSPRDRELLILRTGWNCRSRYEWGQHVLIARECGLTDAEIARVSHGPDADGWVDHERLLLTAADELHHSSSMSDATWEGLAATYSVEQMLDVIATVGNYHLVAMFLNSTRVALDAGVPDVEMPPA
jgi:4-carboxymuconolactone decarboxylase